MRNRGTPAERWAIGFLSVAAAITFFFPLVTLHIPIAGDQDLSGYDAVSKITRFRQQFVGAASSVEGKPEVAPAASATEALPLQAGEELPLLELTGNKGCPPGEYNDMQVNYFEESAAKDPSNAMWPATVAIWLYCMRRFDQAAEWFERLVELEPQMSKAHTDLGTCYFVMGRASDALREYRKSLDIQPVDEQTLAMAIRVSLEGKHDTAVAREMWERLHNLNPNHPILHRWKEIIDEGSRRQAEAEAETPRSVRLLWLIPVFLVSSLACSLVTFLGSFFSARLVKFSSVVGTAFGAAAIVHLVVVNSDVHSVLLQSVNGRATELRGNPFAGLAQTIGDLAVNAFQLKPGGGLYALTITLALAAFLSNSGLLRRN